MGETPGGRAAHPCIARRCGHAAEQHTRTPELEDGRDIVIWCANCRRHEVRSLGWFSSPRRGRPTVAVALPFRAV